MERKVPRRPAHGDRAAQAPSVHFWSGYPAWCQARTPPSSTAPLRSSYPAAISSRAARALVRSSTQAQYRMITRSGGSDSATCPPAASIVASGSEGGCVVDPPAGAGLHQAPATVSPQLVLLCGRERRHTSLLGGIGP